MVAGALGYLAGFFTDHLVEYDSASATTQRLVELSWDAALLLPLVATGVATHLWPRWWLVLHIAALMFLWPLGLHEVELATGVREPLGPGCDPCVDTTFMSILAFPALVIGLVSCGATRWRRRRKLRRQRRPSSAARSRVESASR